MNRRDRLKKVILAAFDKNEIKSEAVSQCNEAIQYVINETPISQEIVETEAYNELKLRGLSEDKLPELIGKISQRYFIKTIEDRRLLKMMAIKAYVEFLVDNFSQIETILREHGYEGKIVKATPISNPNDCTIFIPIIPIYFGDYIIGPDKPLCFRVTMKCKGHQSKMVNVKLR